MEREAALADESEIGCVTLVGADSGGYPLAVTSPTKGGEDLKYMGRCVIRFLQMLRFSKVRIFSDQEPSMRLLMENVKRDRQLHTEIMLSPMGSSQSNGRAERMIQSIRKLAVTLRICFESVSYTHLTLPTTPYV